MTLEEIKYELKELEKDREGMRLLVNDLSKRYKEKGDRMNFLINQRNKIIEDEKNKKIQQQKAQESWDSISK